ncbi:phage integrase N-terminal SAM-like domain-containing protein [Desulfocastanea catecholica]
MENKEKFKLMVQVAETLRHYHYARSTEKTYSQWIPRYICFYVKKRHPKDMGTRKLSVFVPSGNQRKHCGLQRKNRLLMHSSGGREYLQFAQQYAGARVGTGERILTR